MRLYEAIKHAKEVAHEAGANGDCKCAKEHEQLVKWLTELQEFRKHNMKTDCVREIEHAG